MQIVPAWTKSCTQFHKMAMRLLGSGVELGILGHRYGFIIATMDQSWHILWVAEFCIQAPAPAQCFAPSRAEPSRAFKTLVILIGPFYSHCHQIRTLYHGWALVALPSQQVSWRMPRLPKNRHFSSLFLSRVNPIVKLLRDLCQR